MWYIKKRGNFLTKQEFHSIREKFGKTQKGMAELLGVSLKAVQSFEQGWRKVPNHVERQLFFLSALKRGLKQKSLPCWEARNCPKENREGCPAWEFQAGQFCWLVNGTHCQGRVKKTREQKLESCKKCKILGLLLAG
jgi:hypothetical protein